MRLSHFFERVSPQIGDCELSSVLFDKRKGVLTLYVKAEDKIDFSQLTLAENTIKFFLGISDVRIIHEQNQSQEQAGSSSIPGKRPAENVVVITEKAPPPKSEPVSGESTAAIDGNILLGKKITIAPIPMENLAAQSEVVVSGEVFGKDSRVLKNGKTLTIISFTDKTSSAMMKFFTDSKKKTEAEKIIKSGMTLLVHGKYVFDDFEKTSIIEPVSIMQVEPELKTDDYDGEKRIELHLHTKMSDMDATNTAAEYVKRAYKWGHKAVAITDHGNVQAYPEAMYTYEGIMKSEPDADFKVIYGMEAYFVNDGKPLISEGGRFPFSGEFIVFDVETTGLSPGDCRITEIGAVKLRDMEIVEEFSTFVNPDVPIPDEVIKINGITNDMVKDAPYEKEAFEKLIEFCGGTSDAALIAHNAGFDTGFLRSGFARCGLDYNFAAIDTLALSRAATPDLKKHSLDSMVNHYKLGSFNHHRALDDARVTALLFKRIVSDAAKGRVLGRVADLNTVFGGIDVKKDKYYHLIILVKNKTGLKNLYKLISYSNLYYFHSKPRIPLSELVKHREGLLIGSACEQGELYQAALVGRSKQDLAEIAALYDFLEIQPTGNNAFLVRNGEIDSEFKLQLLNKKIYDLGKELDKPVVATGDVHFMNADDSVFREILQTGQGYKDADNQAPLFFRTTAEMLSEFDYLGEDGAREVVIDNPHKVAAMICHEEIRPIPKGEYRPYIEGAEEELVSLCRNRANALYQSEGQPLNNLISARMKRELDSIIKHKFSVLYIIAHKLVKKSEEDGYLVGSRGSVGSSFAAFLSGISEVNPLPPHYRCPKCRYTEFPGLPEIGSGFDLPEKQCPQCGEMLARDGHDIPFETFLGFDGDKAPDIDLNFSGEYQAQAHKYTEELFGKDNVFKAGTISAIQDKTAFGFVKKFLEGRGVTPNKAEINRLVAGCVGVKKTTSQHPGGMLVVPVGHEVYDFTPIQHPAEKTEGNIITTHFDYRALHDTITKLDELGHDVPTLYKHLGDMTGIKIADVPTSDEKVMKLFTSAKPLGLSEESPLFPTGTYGLPEMGTPFVIQMLKEAKPKTFADLLQISGLSHGTDVWIGNARDLIASGQCTISEVIGTRDNIMVYLMQKGMQPSLAFKITEITRKGGAAKAFNDDIYAAFKEHDVPDWYVEACKKIKYMFPKAHAAAYVMGAVKLGWFKVYRPKEFYSAALMRHTENIDAPVVIKGKEAVKKRLLGIESSPEKTPKESATYDALLMVYEMQLRGINLLPAYYKTSHPTRYIIEGDGLRLPYSAIDGCGENAARRLYEVIQSGDFICIDDIGSKSGLNKTVLEKLVQTEFFGDLPQSAQISLFEL
ncbi:MAG: PolC-type DNA polymerase III [Oscillospiraceae bacterium]|nr:PolC-type DNA polymerase III [Oscillospiraceae bacterium]